MMSEQLAHFPGDVVRLQANLAKVFASVLSIAEYLAQRSEPMTRALDSSKDELQLQIMKLYTTSMIEINKQYLTNPYEFFNANARLFDDYGKIFASSVQQLNGMVSPEKQKPSNNVDPRFNHHQWQTNPAFNYLKQFYLATSKWCEESINNLPDTDDRYKDQLTFFVRYILNAVSPSNFITTNPEILEMTIKTNGENLVNGLELFFQHLKEGKGVLKLRQTDYDAFALGENIALTPGKIIYQNEICQIIQYNPQTTRAFYRPLLIIPPWINKYYILDLTKEKSFVRWLVEQGHTVFLISWVNPQKRHASLSLADYLQQGILNALDVIEQATGVKSINAMGYCIGGTLLAMTLAYLAGSKGKKDHRIKSATFLAAQIDFSYAGDLKLFIDESQLKLLEELMKQSGGILPSGYMATVFNMLRPNDLVWPYVITNYLMGEKPRAFDLLYWNSDGTNMAIEALSSYLRECYLENNLSTGQMTMLGVSLDLRKIKIPIYSVATRTDHITPARSIYYGSSFFGGEVKFVLADSGHIAGIINPPHRHKYQYWIGSKPQGSDLKDWFGNACAKPGSWWPDWQEWTAELSGQTTCPHQPGGDAFTPIEDAPGSYVKAHS